MLRYLPLLLLPGMALASEPRFTGIANLSSAQAASPDGRYRLDARLQPTSADSATGRFSMRAALKAGAKAIGTTCGPLGDALFDNGFEN